MLREVKAVPSTCRFVIMNGLFHHHTSEADWFNLQIAVSHSLEELKAPQLQTVPVEHFVFYHYKGSTQGKRLLSAFLLETELWKGQ